MGSSAFSHDLWVQASNKDRIEADLIYGHDFTTPEKISNDRLSLFEPINVIGENTNIVLSQEGENYHYQGKEKLKKGTYIVQATYKPTPWIQTADGKWEMNKTRKDTKKEVKSCGIYSMSGKSILVVGNDDGQFATTLLGKGVEITPMVKATDIKEGVALKFKVTKDGKALKLQEVYGNLEGYSQNEMSMPFYAKTDLSGEFIFKPLKKGQWYLKTNYVAESKNQNCEKTGDKSTLSFEVH